MREVEGLCAIQNHRKKKGAHLVLDIIENRFESEHTLTRKIMETLAYLRQKMIRPP